MVVIINKVLTIQVKNKICCASYCSTISPVENLDTIVSQEPAENLGTVVSQEPAENLGTVVSLKDGIAICDGLKNIAYGEVVKFPQYNIEGLALNLEHDQVGVVLLADESYIKQGDIATASSQLVQVHVGTHVLGRIMNGLGVFIDEIDTNNLSIDIDNACKAAGEAAYNDTWNYEDNMICWDNYDSTDDESFFYHADNHAYDAYTEAFWNEYNKLTTERETDDRNVDQDKQYLWNIERKAPGVITRLSVSEPLLTGYKVVDALLPIGKGQRELIIGDRQTGKTTLAIDAILAQQYQNDDYDNDVVAIYVGIGQKLSSILNISNVLQAQGANKYTAIVCTSAAESAALQYLAPYTGACFGEYFRDNGMNALIIYDDLTKHAVAYRQLSLLLRRPPGREAFPGDVFYAHSRLLERACKLNNDFGGGSLTALPIIETQAGDLSGYIPTNVISITDGQIFMEKDLFFKGIRPAVNVGNSVSRVGSKAQPYPLRLVTGNLRYQLAQYREYLVFAQFDNDIDAVTRGILNRGAMLTEILKQGPNKPLPLYKEVIAILAAAYGFINPFIKDFKKQLHIIPHYEQASYDFAEGEEISELFEPIYQYYDLSSKDLFTLESNPINFVLNNYNLVRFIES